MEKLIVLSSVGKLYRSSIEEAVKRFQNRVDTDVVVENAGRKDGTEKISEILVILRYELFSFEKYYVPYYLILSELGFIDNPEKLKQDIDELAQKFLGGRYSTSNPDLHKRLESIIQEVHESFKDHLSIEQKIPLGAEGFLMIEENEQHLRKI
jgi:hypothetical protein